jgi:hypothetical protein
MAQVDALTLVTRVHLLSLCRLAVHMGQQRCPLPLLAGPGGRPRRSRDESLLLLALLRTLWRLSYHDLHEWMVAWPALACAVPTDASGRVLVPGAPQLCWRQVQAGAPPCACLLVVLVRLARHWRLIAGRDLIVESAPILAWQRRGPGCSARPCPAPPYPPPALLSRPRQRP